MESAKAPLKYYQRHCPNCNKIIEAEFTDIGVGMQQTGPFGCEDCGWLETSAEEDARTYGIDFDD